MKKDKKPKLYGCMSGTVEIIGDIVGPTGAFDLYEDDEEILKEEETED